jgi:hypothetical protein
MLDLTAGAIAKLAFEAMVKAGAGQVAKKLSADALDLLTRLRAIISARLMRNPDAAASLTRLERGDENSLTDVARLLEGEMERDPAFAADIRNLAQQITQQVTSPSKVNVNVVGRDLNYIEQIGSAKIGGS